MSELPNDEPSAKPPLWRSLLPSLAILVGTFFFISAACFSDGDSEPYYGYPQCTADNDTTVPPGSEVRIGRPEPGEVFAQLDADGLAVIPIELSAIGVEIVPASECRSQTGHFRLALRLLSHEGCASPVLQPVELTQGETEWEYRLPPGSYELGVSVLTGSGASYVPALTNSVHFVIEGEPIPPDGGVCP